MNRSKAIALCAMAAVLFAFVALAADYRESTTTGTMTTWRRAHTVSIANPYLGVPTIVFREEDRIRLPDGTTIAGPGVRDPEIRVSMDAPLTEFPLRHPATGEIIGTARHQDLYVMLYSLYLDLAAKRDVAAQLTSAPMIETGSVTP